MQSFNQNVIKHKLGLLNLATELGNVSKACKVMGLSRDTLYRYQTAVESGGVEALFDQNRRKPNLKNRIDEATSDRVRAYAVEHPAHGQVRASNELRKAGVFVSPSGVRSIWLRHDLACFKQRLVALEKHVAARCSPKPKLLPWKRRPRTTWRMAKSRQHTPATSAVRTPSTSELSRAYLPADLCRYLLQMGRRQALHHQDADHGSRLAQRPGAAGLCRARHVTATHPDRPRHGILRAARDT